MTVKRLSLQEITDRIDSKYALVVAAARRGREIMDGEQVVVNVHATKPVTIALEEIQRGYSTVEVPPSGIK